jgi:cobalamin biosynthesis Co2+ chelatase CbiK
MNKNFSKTKENGFDTIVVSFNKGRTATGSEDESVKEEFEEYKNDFRGMIVGSISSIKQHCENILNNLDKEYVKENLTEPFLQSQIAIAEDYVLSMHNYVMFNEREEEDMEAEAARKGLWDNIHKKKKRMGKNYKPAKPGSPDRPDKDAWEKAQK